MWLALRAGKDSSLEKSIHATSAIGLQSKMNWLALAVLAVSFYIWGIIETPHSSVAGSTDILGV